MSELIISKSGSSGELELDKPLTIVNAVSIRETLLSAINSVNELIIRHRNIEEIDLSYLQLLYALSKYADAVNKKIIFENLNDRVFKKAFKESGLISNKTIQKLFGTKSERGEEDE